MTEALHDLDLDRALAGAAAEIDRDIAASAAVGRATAAVLAAVIARPVRRVPWFAIAAALLLAAGLGSLADMTIVGDRVQNVVLLDPLVFGPAEVDAQ